MNFLIRYLNEHRKTIVVFLLFVLIFTSAFWLYGIPFEAILYPAAVCIIIGALFLLFCVLKAYRKHCELKRIAGMPSLMIEAFAEPKTQDDEDYQSVIKQIWEEYKAFENKMNVRYTDMVDYYTIWAHQIKTPIASMRLTLQNEDSAAARRLYDDLFKIEQYVEMVLMFLRLDSDSTDYVIRKYSIDSIVKQAVRKFSTQFIGKKIRLNYEPINDTVITDEKWLLFVIEQLLSNAVKYTPAGGSVTISMDKSKILTISDNGIGIAPEDLPRIFEKGYTGYNGRSDKKASGIGLYLCKRICGNLGHNITANSSLESGTVISINLGQKKMKFE